MILESSVSPALASHLPLPTALRANGDIVPPTGFTRNVCEFLDRISYRVMRSEEDLRLIARHRYESYKSMGLIADKAEELWMDEYDRTPGYRNIGMFLDGELVAGNRFNLVNQHFQKSMSVEMYPLQMKEMLDAGMTFIESSRTFTTHDGGRRMSALPFALMRLVGIGALHHGVSHVLMNIRDTHAKFYEKVLGSRTIEGTNIPYKDHNMVIHVSLVTAEIEPLHARSLTTQQYFLTTADEAKSLFSDETLGDGEIRPSVSNVLSGLEDHL